MRSLQIYALSMAKKSHRWHRDGSEAGSNPTPLIKAESRQNKFQVRTRRRNWMSRPLWCVTSDSCAPLAESSMTDVIFSPVRGWYISETGLGLANESFPKLSSVRNTWYTSLVLPSPISMTSKAYIYLVTLNSNSRFSTKILLPLERGCNIKCVPSVIRVNQYAAGRQPGTTPMRRA